MLSVILNINMLGITHTRLHFNILEVLLLIKTIKMALHNPILQECPKKTLNDKK